MRIINTALLIMSCLWINGQSNTLDPIDIFDLEFVSDPQISPDGEKVVYVRNFKDIMTDGNRSNLWIINVDGTGHKPLTSGNHNQYSPRWSPDGQKLVYLSTAEGKPQVFMRWMDDGTTAKITNLVTSPTSIQWSPDGSNLALTMRIKEKEKGFNVLPAKPEGAKWADPPIYIDQVYYRRDGRGYTDVAHNQIFLLSTDGGTPRQITYEKFDHYSVSWSPDGKYLYYSANHHQNRDFETNNSEIHRMELSSGNVETLTDRYGPDRSATISPDGKHMAYTGLDDTHQGYMVNHIYLAQPDGTGSKLWETKLDRRVSNLNWSADGKSIYFQYDDRGNTYVSKVDMQGKTTVLAENVGGLSLGRPYSGGTYSVADNGSIAYTHSTPDHPADLAVVVNGETKRLTHLNQDLFDYKALGEVEEIWYKSSFDGRDIQGWIVKPPNFDPAKKYPLLLEIHGGPFANYGSRFSAEVQLFASKGYVVLYTNPRGSSSYGQEFGNLIHHNYPGEDYDDLISGVDAVIAKGYVDEGQLYVTGGSGGGVLSSWIIGKTDRFRAAVVAKPVINWYSFVLYADNLGFFSKYWFPGHPWDHVDHYMSRSPISLVKNVKTPTMLLTGEQDWRTPISESEQYYAALKLNGVECAMVRIPGASHGIAAKPSQLIAKVNSITKWFEMHKEDTKP